MYYHIIVMVSLCRGMHAGVVIEVPKDNLSTEVVNNSKERHEYRFAKVFDRDARQEEVLNLTCCVAGLSLPNFPSRSSAF